MNRNSCRELKQQVLVRARGLAREIAEAHAFRIRSSGARAARDRRVEMETVSQVAAVGVGPGRGRDYKLAVRLFRGYEGHQARLLRGLDRHRDEIDLATGVRYRPRVTLSPGGSCGHFRITAGTLGGFVEDDEHYYVLSNNHVLANSNCCFAGDRILQPGPSDITSGYDVIAHLDRWYPLSRESTDGVDAAIARLSDAVTSFYPWDYTGIGRVGKSPVTDRFSVTDVIKRGRTTGVTRGNVSAYELDGVQIDYGTPSNPAVVTFDDQIEVIHENPFRKDFSAGGDSGSYIVDRDTLKPYALLYGGGPDDQGIDRTLAHFLPDVLRALGVRLVQ